MLSEISHFAMKTGSTVPLPGPESEGLPGRTLVPARKLVPSQSSSQTLWTGVWTGALSRRLRGSALWRVDSCSEGSEEAAGRWAEGTEGEPPPAKGTKAVSPPSFPWGFSVGSRIQELLERLSDTGHEPVQSLRTLCSSGS